MVGEEAAEEWQLMDSLEAVEEKQHLTAALDRDYCLHNSHGAGSSHCTFEANDATYPSVEIDPVEHTNFASVDTADWYYWVVLHSK